MQCPCSGGKAGPLLLLVVFACAWLLFNWIKTSIKTKGVSFVNKAMKILIVVVLIAVVGIVFALKQKSKAPVSEPLASVNSEMMTVISPEGSKNIEATVNLPRLVDLGAGKCIPCKLMAPILEELKSQYQGELKVVVIDVWENPDEAPKYDVKLIPTQIFYDAAGKELYRHEGFYSKEDILAKWKELGIEFKIK
jgi:thioredoxin 1